MKVIILDGNRILRVSDRPEGILLVAGERKTQSSMTQEVYCDLSYPEATELALALCLIADLCGPPGTLQAAARSSLETLTSALIALRTPRQDTERLTY